MNRRPATLQGRALMWLAQREHSPQELQRKLLRAARESARTAARATAEAAKPVDDASDPAALRDDETDDETLQARLRADVEAVITRLQAAGHLSSERFIASRLHQRQARWGRQRISQELAQHGLSLDTEAAADLARTEQERALQVWQRKFGQPAQDAAGRARQMRFLASRGFALDVIRRVVPVASHRPTDDDAAAEPDVTD
ncbi:regulatory protein RecX [Pseudaquabacterium rugosum]|uniref:Regulatory protein RecX n=1 Tax=Pseudaquabacterium rugosum TaxID=2984194 RepID=A0ABU9BJ07_9BURK